MNRVALPAMALLTLASPAAALSGGLPAKPTKPPIAKRVWVSEEVEALRERGLISLPGQAPAEVAAEEHALSEPDQLAALAPRPIRAKDPEWYAEQVAMHRAAIAVHYAEIRLVRRQLSDARYWEAGINLNRENTGITPENALWVLEGRNRTELARLDALADQARRNEIPPSALR